MRSIWVSAWLALGVAACGSDDPPAPGATASDPVTAIATPGAAAAAPAPAPGLIARVVIDGAPVAGAEVQVSDGSRPTLATAVTDRDGVARFEGLVRGPYELWARDGARVSALARVADARAPVELALAPGGRIAGEVVGDGALPANARVRLIPVDVDHAVRAAPLDARHQFAIDGVPRGRWRLHAEADGFVAVGADPTIVVGDAPGRAVVVKVSRAGVVSGTVVDPLGEPVRDATIVLHADGATGEVATPIAIADGVLRWVHPLAGRRLLPSHAFVRFGAPRKGHRPVECGGGHCGVDIGWIRGTIIHAAADGKVARIVRENRGEAGRMVVVEHAGGLSTYYLHMEEPRRDLAPGQLVRAGEPLGTMGETGAARGPHLHFAITQHEGGRRWFVNPEPVLEHAVVLPASWAFDPSPPDALTVAGVVGTLGAPANLPDARRFTTDAHGRFRIPGVMPGRYVASAFATAFAPGTSARFAVKTGAETADVAIALQAGILVEGRVTGRDGPIAGATVIATAGSGESAQQVAATTTSATGAYALTSLSGRVTLSVTAAGHGTTERAIAIPARGDDGLREDFTLVSEDARLRGQVLDADGGPPGVVRVRVVDGPTHSGQAVTDAAGRFEIRGVAAGRYVVELQADDHPTTRLALVADRFADIRLARSGRVRCAVRDARSGTALPGIRIEASGPDGRTASAVTDAQGVAELRALVVGAWTVRARAAGFAAIQRAVTVRPTAVPEDLRLELARGATITGVVRDRYGRRVAGATVTTEGATARCDADGTYRLVDLPPGPRWIEAELDGARGAVELDLEAGDDRPAVDVELRDP